MDQVETVSVEWLMDRLDSEAPDNRDPRRGFALVSVLDPEAFAEGHIPGSINIPEGQEAVFERRFERSKEIVVYCASDRCKRSASVVSVLLRRGFDALRHLREGTDGWQSEGFAVARGGSSLELIDYTSAGEEGAPHDEIA